MKGHIPSETIEDVKIRANIVDIVSEYIALRKTGKNYVGLCPFHREKTPSFTVNPEKQIFYCFGCGEGGNVITFLMKMNNMSFPESVKHLAGKVGVTIPERKINPGDKTRTREKEKLYRINTIASEFFSKHLFSPGGNKARSYLEKRGIESSVAKNFSLGYAPEGWRNLKDFFSGKNISLELAQKAGLIITNDKGNVYDRFRGRITFPIEDLNGKIVAFGGRVLGQEEPKYLNSPESPVYIKGKTLYGLYRTKGAISKKNEVILVEGYLDFLSLVSAGLTNVVATLGTALTRDQVHVVRRFTRNVSVLFDSDEAGRAAVVRSLRVFLEEEMHARVVVLPEGYDPDKYVRKYGKEAMEALVDQSPSMVDYYIKNVMNDGESLEDKLTAVKDSVGFIGSIADPIQRNLFIKRVSEQVGIDQELLKDEVNKVVGSTKKYIEEESLPPGKGKTADMVEVSLIHMIMEYPDKIQTIVREKIFNYFMDGELKKLGEMIVESHARGEKGNLSDLINDVGNSGTMRKFLKLAMEEKPFDHDVVDRVFADTMKKIRLRWYQNRRRILQRELVKAQKMGDMTLCDRIIVEKGKLLIEEKLLQA